MGERESEKDRKNVTNKVGKAGDYSVQVIND